MSDIRAWLDELGLGEYEPLFADNRVDMAVLPHLAESDLKELDIPLGDRKKLMAAIAALEARPTEQPPSEAERRQITVMFCDLVGSTALSEKLDPEDLRALMAAYQKACGDVVERYEGHVAQYLGDGLMVYFGWPAAHEDDAGRAIRTGLEIVAALKHVEAPEPLRVRIGVATGPVVVGETGAGDASVPQAAVGETPNVAARMQGLAGPGEVVIAPTTHRLAAGAFDYDDLGEHALKGIVEAVRAWRVVGESAAVSRFEARAAGRLTPLVGREHETGLLLDRWRQAKEGEGQVVLLSGEPGIGKSRITQALRERVAEEPHVRLRYQCSPYHANSAFYPVIARLERAAGFARDDGADAKLDKLEVALADETENPPQTAALFASLLSLPLDRYPALDLSAQKQKESTIAALADQVVALAQARPVLMIFEDAHWIDPTTLETLGAVIERIQNCRVLLVITYRPEFEPPWTGHGHVATLTLNRLSRRQGADMVAKVTGGKALPDEVLDQIVAKTDGVPLFVEELTKTVLEAGFLTEHADRYTLDGPLPPLAIPATLQDSLMARLDRLATVKETAQLGACIGREFSHELLAAVSPLGDNELAEALQELAASELVFQRGTPPDATYTFKHALVQDAAYESLLKSRRRQLHATIGKALEDLSSEVSQGAPETLAHHFTRAGLSEPALTHWLAAAKDARRRSANREAIGHLRSGLALLDGLPESDERDEIELEFQATLAPMFFMTVGWASSDGFVAFQRAHELCVKTKDVAHLPYVLAGLAYSQRWRGQENDSERLIARLFDIASASDKRDHLLLAYMLRGQNLMFRGNNRESQKHLECALKFHVLPDHRNLALECGFDPAVTAMAWNGYMYWYLGCPDQAKIIARQSISLAEKLAHAATVAFAYATPGADLHYFMRDLEAVEEYAERAIFVSDEHGGFAQFAAMARLHQGWVMARRKQFDVASPQLSRALAEYRATGASAVIAPRLTAEVADAHGMAGRADEGLQILAKSPDRVRGEPVRFAEIFRIEGELMLGKAEPDENAAERLFLEAIEIAREDESICWELRAAICLARFWVEQGKSEEAENLLAPIYGRFEEGFETTDLKAARALLDELA